MACGICRENQARKSTQSVQDLRTTIPTAKGLGRSTLLTLPLINDHAKTILVLSLPKSFQAGQILSASMKDVSYWLTDQTLCYYNRLQHLSEKAVHGTFERRTQNTLSGLQIEVSEKAGGNMGVCGLHSNEGQYLMQLETSPSLPKMISNSDISSQRQAVK